MRNKYLHRKWVTRIILCVLLLTAVGMTEAMAQTYTNTLEGSDVSLTSAPIGDIIEAKTVGVIPYGEEFITQEEVMERYYAITSFRMIDTTTVAVLTGASDMILVYSFTQNQILNKIQLPISARAFDYDNGLFHVIGDRTYLTIDAEGWILERKDFQEPQLPNEEIFIITDLKVIDGQPIIHECNANTYSITSDGLQKIDTFYFDQSRRCKIHPKDLDENSFVLYNETPSRSGRSIVSMESLGIEGKLACLNPISVDDDFIAINFETSHNRTGRFVKSYLLVVNANGELINLVEVPINFISYIHKPFLYKDNAWYYAFSGEEGISIFKISTNTNRIDSPDSFMLSDETFDYSYRELEYETSHEDTNGNSPMRDNWRTITQAWENAERYCNLEWTPVSGNVSESCHPITSNGYITTPVINYNPQIGIPYKYSGFTNWDVFKGLASDGTRFTGNKHCYSSQDDCYHDPYLDGNDTYVLGVDCSGFVSRCWELSSHVWTGDIPNHTQYLGDLTSHFNDGTLRTCDALNFIGRSECINVQRHVMMFAYHPRNDNSIVVFESSSYDWKTSQHSRGLSYFQGNYTCKKNINGTIYTYSYPLTYTIQRYPDMRDIRLRLGSAITLSQNGSTVTTVTRGQPLTVNYSVYNGGSETWTGYVRLYIEQSDGDLMCINNCDVNNPVLTTIYAGQTKNFTFSNNEVISPPGTTKLYVKVVNYNANDYGWYHPYDVGDGDYSNPLVFQIVGGGDCSTCPDYDESWSINDAEVGEWIYKGSSLESGACRIYKVQLLSSYTYTFQTCCEGYADFDTQLYLYDANCNLVASNDNVNGTLQSSIEYTNTGSNAYFYLKIQGYNSASGYYIIAAKREGQGSTCNSCPDYDESWSITGEGDWSYKSSSIGSGGCRIYRVRLISDYTYTFQTGCDQGTANFDTRLYLYDASCNQVAYNDDGCDDNLSIIEYTNTGSNAYYYLKINGYGSAAGSYTIAAKRESPSTCKDCPDYDELWAVHNLADVGEWTYTSSSIVSGGCHIYKVPLISNYTYTFQTGCDHGTADFDTRLYLYDASCNEVAFDDDGCSNYLSSIEYTNTGSSAYYYLKVDGYSDEAGSYTIAAMRESPSITYVIDVSASPSAGGTVGGAGTYQSGSTCTLTASPNTGYNFVRWTKNGSQVSTNATYSFTVTENASYIAEFSQNSYTITVSVNPSNCGTVSGGGSYNHGSTCTLTAMANDGYSFANWTENGSVVSANTSYSFTVTGSRALVANFTEELNIPISTEGLMAYYPFNGNANDESGNGNHGVLCGNQPQLTTDRFGNENCAYLFGGYNNSGYIQVPNSSSLQLDNALTISFWMNLAGYDGMDGWGSYVDYGNFAMICKPGDRNGFSVMANRQSDDSLHVWSFNNNGCYDIHGYQEYQLGQWIHCVVTIENTISKLYLNGVLRQESINNQADFSNANNQNMYIGIMNGFWYPFNGKIDDIFLYNRALSSQEVQILYDFDEDLVAYYPFDGDVNDYSGNGNHGTIIGNVVPAMDRHGNPNGAYRIPGEPFNYISVPDSDILHLSSFTLSAWVYTDADNYGSGNLINKGRDINNGSYRLYVRGVGATTLYGGINDASIETDPETGQWHMVTGTVEGDLARYYLDGVLQAEATLSQPFSYNNTQPLTFGVHYYEGVPSSWAYTLLGVMDEVRIYRRALSPIEVQMLYGNDQIEITAIANPTGAGIIEGTGSYVAGAMCTLTATANEGYSFVNWTENGNVVSTDATYSFMVTGSRHLVAFFSPPLNITAEATPSEGGTVCFSPADFEDQQIPPTWSNDATYPWVVTTPDYLGYNGSFCMMSGNGGVHSSTSSIEVTVDFVENGTVSFLAGCWGEGSDASNWDKCRFYIDGVIQMDYAAHQRWENVSFDVTAGNHTFTWTYKKDSSVNPTGDAFFVDDVIFTGVGIGSQFNYGQTCSLSATPNKGYAFAKWTNNGNVVSCYSPYSFTVTEDADYVAHFEEVPGILVGNPESANQYLPSYSFYKYTLSQQIYTPDEIWASGNIISVSYFNTGGTKTRNYDIYMVHTDKSSFESNTDWITVSEADRVFSGDVTMTSGCWTTIVLDTPFAYNGTSNLAIIIDDNSGNYTGSPHMSCRVFNTEGNQAIRVYSDGTNYDPYYPSGYNGVRYSVKNEIVLGISKTQAIALSAGWNWVSFNVEITMADLQASLLGAYPSSGTNALVVKSKGEGQTAYNPTVNRWVGSLSTLDLSQMYMVKVPADGENSVVGMPINPKDYTATIAPGANWIAFPLGQSMSITDAFAGFPANGDIVKAKGGGQAQWNSAANRWIGALVNAPLQPGQGYMYNSKSTGNRTFTFPVSAK